MTVHVLREALVLGHLGHLDEVALAAFEKALEIRLLKPLVVIGKPLEQVVGVEVHRTIGDFTEGISDIAGVVRDSVAVLAEVEARLQVLDGGESLWHWRVLELMLCLALRLHALDLLLYLIKLVVKGLRDVGDFRGHELHIVLEPVEGLAAGLVGANGLRRLLESHLIGEVVDMTAIDRERVARQRGEHIRCSRLAVDIRVGLVRGGEGLDAGLAELAGVLAVLGREVTRTLADDIEVELGEEVGDPLCVVVVWHGGSFPRLLRLPNNILLKKRDGAERPSLFG